MAIFHCYVSSPEGKSLLLFNQFQFDQTKIQVPSGKSWSCTHSSDIASHHTNLPSSEKMPVNEGSLWWTYKKLWKMAIEIVDFPMKNGGSFHCYVSSPEDNTSCKIPSSSIGIIIAAKGHIKPGWWYTYPSEKYEFDIPNCFWESH